MKKKEMVRKGIAAVVMVATVIASASTILAYEPFVSTNEEATVCVEEGEFATFESESITGNHDFNNSYSIFIYEDGTKVDVTDEDLTYALCIHSLVSGYYDVHISNSTGGCTVKEYNAKRCTKCGYIEVGSLHATVTYTVCPH